MGNAELKKELETLRGEIKSSQEKSSWAEEDKKFEQDFEKNIAPLLTTDAIPAENLPRLKKLLKTLAFTDEYAKSPLSVIYKGVDDFKQFLPGNKKKSAEDSKGGFRGKEGEKSVLDMNAKEFDEYIASQSQEQNQGKKFDIRRDGRSVSE